MNLADLTTPSPIRTRGKLLSPLREWRVLVVENISQQVCSCNLSGFLRVKRHISERGASRWAEGEAEMTSIQYSEGIILATTKGADCPLGTCTLSPSSVEHSATESWVSLARVPAHRSKDVQQGEHLRLIKPNRLIPKDNQRARTSSHTRARTHSCNHSLQQLLDLATNSWYHTCPRYARASETATLHQGARSTWRATYKASAPLPFRVPQRPILPSPGVCPFRSASRYLTHIRRVPSSQPR